MMTLDSTSDTSVNHHLKRLIQYNAARKSTTVAYVLGLCLGFFGAHRFYLHRTKSASLMVIATLVAILLSFIAFIPLIFIPITWFIIIWVIIDLLIIPYMVRKYNTDLASRLAVEPHLLIR